MIVLKRSDACSVIGHLIQFQCLLGLLYSLRKTPNFVIRELRPSIKAAQGLTIDLMLNNFKLMVKMTADVKT